MPQVPSDTASPHQCGACRSGERFALPFSMAFQPIVNLATGGVYAYEALVRGPNGESAASILSQVTEGNRYGFDQACRRRAIELAAELRLPETGALLSINFLPNAVYEPKTCLAVTLSAARRTGFPLDRLLFEVTESEEVVDHDHLNSILDQYKAMGFLTAIDDFGAGYSGLNLLARFQPNIIKLDMELVRGIDANPVRRAIVGSMLKICRDLSILAIAEGIETIEECRALLELGVTLQQGYLFARPGFECLPVPALPQLDGVARLVA
ncbi:EAL domain-containing protein [Salinarimonas soli]|uniref:EAL domain-containing protein n=1 Tax=Salinarimonas soli TaxID=1638099 RepID=A0A5B2V912_9HYPH|nr:EAL domain-containing protein [Salinarimonas soli]KAA2234940.1 EAL domain-containing protein [Salinarimonas soli]